MQIVKKEIQENVILTFLIRLNKKDNKCVSGNRSENFR